MRLLHSFMIIAQLHRSSNGALLKFINKEKRRRRCSSASHKRLNARVQAHYPV
jgi:hypothetical protein